MKRPPAIARWAVAKGDLVHEAEARRVYERAWDQWGHKMFGLPYGLPAPELIFVDASRAPSAGAAMWTGKSPSGNGRAVYALPAQARALAGGAMASRRALKRVFHEWAHFYQSEDVIADIEGREKAATKFARTNYRHKLKPRGRRRRKPPRADAWRDRGQFGENYGKAPDTIGYWG